MKKYFNKRNEALSQRLVEAWGYKKPINEGRWGSERVDPEIDKWRDSLGGRMAYSLNNTPGARAIQKGFDLASANEPEVWSDESIEKARSRAQDIKDTYFKYNQLLQNLATAQEKYPEIGRVDYYDEKMKTIEQGGEEGEEGEEGYAGYVTLASIETVLFKVAKELKGKGKDSAAKIVKQAAEQAYTLNSVLENLLGHSASR